MQNKRHRGVRVQRCEFVTKRQRNALAIARQRCLVVDGIGQKPGERKAAVVEAPQRQADILRSVELAEMIQKA
ncbi:hypothetical protein [Mesorhizobium sp. SARCC-RB16n]|uniref:hypothetical protein n=1 Tax=Mesorhizobium sp. SARCC-RB16n TaxID=2116687 RepID=UPI00166A13CF|nr:hypothetical protein [Mesorhizobium sp. SARCC-RB16n]